MALKAQMMYGNNLQNEKATCSGHESGSMVVKIIYDHFKRYEVQDLQLWTTASQTKHRLSPLCERVQLWSEAPP